MPTVYRLAVKSAEDFHHQDSRWAGSTAAERIVLAHWHMETDGFNIALPHHTSNKAVTHARVDWGRWITDCPWCHSAQNASREDHRFFCVECGNAAVGGLWIEVVWPDDELVRWVEEVLGMRPSKDNQWWCPPWAALAPGTHRRQSADELVAENLEHGVI